MRKLVTLVARGQLVVGVVAHVLAEDNTGEFDPYFIERIKNAVQLMVDKRFTEVLELEIAASCWKAKQEPSERKVEQLEIKRNQVA